jgi:hypothetical protein
MQACVAATDPPLALAPLQASERGPPPGVGPGGEGQVSEVCFLDARRGITGRLEHKLPQNHHTQPSSVVFGWAGLAAGSSRGKDTWCRVPVVGRPARQPPGRVGVGWRTKAVSPKAEVQWGEVLVMGRGETAEKLPLEEDSHTSIEGGLSHAGILPRATMLQGVNQPFGIRGSWGCGLALRRQPAARTGAGVGALPWVSGPKRRLAGRERAAGGLQGRQERRGLD